MTNFPGIVELKGGLGIVWTIPKDIWNHAVRALMRSRARAGMYCLLLELTDGTLVSADPALAWQHPWFTVPRWTGEEWAATVKPGFVNALDPSVPGAGVDGTDADLLDWPVIPIRNMRTVPGEGEILPAFFRALGVQDPKDKLEVDDFGVTLRTAAEEVPQRPRVLWACDFYLAVARATYESQITQVDASGTSGQIVDYAVGYNADNLELRGSRARLLQAAQFPPVKRPTFQERLQGLFQDDGEDRLLVSTVFFLSPPDVLSGPPDAKWTAFVRHGQFWNLMHSQRNLPPAQAPRPIRFVSGLAAGLGDLIINQNFALNNDIAQRVLNAYNTTTNEGKFWTA